MKSQAEMDFSGPVVCRAFPEQLMLCKTDLYEASWAPVTAGEGQQVVLMPGQYHEVTTDLFLGPWTTGCVH